MRAPAFEIATVRVVYPPTSQAFSGHHRAKATGDIKKQSTTSEQKTNTAAPFSARDIFRTFGFCATLFWMLRARLFSLFTVRLLFEEGAAEPPPPASDKA
jgi:hypothetical protein